MVTLKYIERLRRIDQLIRQQRTGNADDLADRMGISRRQLYNIIDELKEFGLPVCFSRTSKTFYYEYNCKLEINIEVKELNKTEYTAYEGGNIRRIMRKIENNFFAEFLIYNCL